MTDDAYRMGRRSFLRAGGVLGATALAGCATTRFGGSGEQDGLEYHHDQYTLEREEADELRVSNDFWGPHAAYIAADPYLVGITVSNWDDDAVRAGYDLLHVGEDAIDEVAAADAWLSERGEASYPTERFDVDADMPRTPGLQLANVKIDDALVGGGDHNAYFTPAGDEPFEQVHMKQL